MAHQAAARQSPNEPSNNESSPISNSSHPLNNSTSSSYYHHYHHSASGANHNPSVNTGYTTPQNTNQNGSLNGNESPQSDQFSSNNNINNNIQLPETPNSLVTTMMGPTSGNSNSNDAAIAINNEASPSENALILPTNNYSPWCATSGHHQLPNTSPLHSGSYNTPHHGGPASIYSVHHNLSSSLIPHQNISGFTHPHSEKSFRMTQPFYPSSWY